MKNKRVLIIDAANREIREGAVSTLEDCQALVGGLIERGIILENGDEVYINEEGLLDDTQENFFRVEGAEAHRPFAGNGYIIGEVTSSGDNRPAASSISDMRKRVQFIKVKRND